ncbi:phage tail protein [Pseudanabaenaceae cyanobacterium LEGE 13415]|nr:phage tail protein [Pseudanabaenaceae cyanobacterium LEGE 13415]
MDYAYPPVSFFFEVVFLGGGFDQVENRFQSVTGLNAELQTETVKEGGVNYYEHILPVRSKYPPLVLKRGLVKDSKLSDWCMKAILNLDIHPVDLQVRLLHVKRTDPKKPPEKSEPLMGWDVINAYPRKWSVSDFNAEQNAIAIESLELNYSYFKPQGSNPPAR